MENGKFRLVTPAGGERICSVNHETMPFGLVLRQTGEGNGQKNEFVFLGDQFELNTYKLEGGGQTDGTKVEFYGEWELQAFFDLVEQMKQELEK